MPASLPASLTAIFRRIAEWTRYATHALLPGACASCGARSREALCAGCARCLVDNQIRCRCCGLSLSVADTGDSTDTDTCAGESDRYRAHDICGACIARPPAFDATICVADYATPADQLVIALKFQKQLTLSGFLGNMLARRVIDARTPLPDIIVPVPLSAQRLTQRGYNQAWEIARPLARALRRPAVAQCLRRIRDTRAQSGLRGAQRWRNMRRAFTVPLPDRIRGAHVGLVDDVMTSGATLDAAARELRRAGAARVTVLVVLRTPTH